MSWQITVSGVDTLTIYFGDQIDEQLSPRILQARRCIEKKLHDRVLEMVPSYTSLLVQYDLLKDDRASITAALEKCLASLSATGLQTSSGELKIIPVCYDKVLAPDLELLAHDKRLSVEEVIQRHCAKRYVVFAVGFMPGFAFLGKVDPSIATPRIATPRSRVPKGAVGIADQQTGIYPSPSPGGWNLIGRTPVDMFDPKRAQAAFLQVGDQVSFEAISLEQFDAMGGER
ncbi:5-oxoprolinase subunit PxpB [Pokkaliibacter sp. CJK22405]|uniref:5-oxoprolinase subunit PxpB n=1 Tax=Pokkaliibacter sp. CJK22405 TaxID=3384615 RepID=UPI003984CDEB